MRLNLFGSQPQKNKFLNDILVGSKIIHDGDVDTFFIFEGDKVTFSAGGVYFFQISEAAQDEFIINIANTDIDVIIKNDTDTTMFIDGSVAPSVSIYYDTLIAEYIKHIGDTHTNLRFTDDTVRFNAGGSTIFGGNATGISFFGVAYQTKQAHIADAVGDLAALQAKFNTLLADLEGYGLLATS